MGLCITLHQESLSQEDQSRQSHDYSVWVCSKFKKGVKYKHVHNYVYYNNNFYINYHVDMIAMHNCHNNYYLEACTIPIENAAFKRVIVQRFLEPQTKLRWQI